MKESSYRSKICTELRKLGCIVIPIVGTAAGGSGYPDTMILTKKLDFFIEFKGPTTKIRPIQRVVLEKIRKKGSVAYVLRSPGLLLNPDGTFVCEVANGFELVKAVYTLNSNKFKEK